MIKKTILMNKQIRYIAIKIFCLYIVMMHNAISKLSISTYNFPPYSIQQGQRYTGEATTSLVQILEEAGITDYEINLYPLKRALRDLSLGEIDIFYPYPVVSNKKQLTHVIGPIANFNLALITKAEKKLQPTLATINQYEIGVERGSLSERIALKQGINVQLSSKNEYALKKLMVERFDVWVTGLHVGIYFSILNKLSHKVNFAKIDKEYPLYIHISDTVSSKDLAKIQTAFTKLQSEHYFDEKNRRFNERLCLISTKSHLRKQGYNHLLCKH